MTISVTSSDSNNKKIKINKELLMRLAPLLSLIILVIFFSFGCINMWLREFFG